MSEIIDYLQLGTNGFALIIAGWIYIAYVTNLKGSLQTKDEQLKVVEKNMSFWKDKANELERKSPEYIEEVLAKRIKHREEEIRRLNEDKTDNLKLLTGKTRELGALKQELEKSKYLGKALSYYDLDTDQEIIIPETDIEIEELGEVFVDSASLLITDPMYIRDEWRTDVEYDYTRLYKHIDNEKIYQFGVDFKHYEDKLNDFDKSVNELIQEGKLKPIEVERELTYSLPGALYATSTKKGYGELEFRKGHTGAGICVKTVYGDGAYTVYGERYKGDLLRVYIELQ